MQWRRAVVWLLLITSCCLLQLSSAAQRSVQTDLDLQRALRDPQVDVIVVATDIQLQPSTWFRRDQGRPAYVLQRNVSIRSQSGGRARLDFQFLAANYLQVDAGVWLTFKDLIFKQSRYGAGMSLDFLAPSAGSTIVYDNVIVQRLLCMDGVDEPISVRNTPRLPGWPGQQKAHYGAGYCLSPGVCASKTTVYEDLAKISTLSVDTAGGYSVIMRNTTKFCLDYTSKCIGSAVTDACMQKALDNHPTAAPTPGRVAAAADAAAAAAAAAEAQRRQRASMGAAIGSTAGAALLLLLVLGVLLLVNRRRWCQQGSLLQLPDPKSGSPDFTAAGLVGRSSPDTEQPSAGRTTASPFSKDVELGVPTDSSSSVSSAPSMCRPPLATLAAGEAQCVQPLGPPCMHERWELAAWKTSSHSLRRFSGVQQYNQQQQLQYLAGVCDLDLPADALGGAAAVRRGDNQEPGIHALILQGTGAATSAATMVTNKISLGMCIGAGSFGKVYKARWRNLDVAVKVVQHSQASAASVANEIDLMMSFQHPHLVSAYHFVTWRRRKEIVQPDSSEQRALPPTRQSSHSGSTLSCSNDRQTPGAQDTEGMPGNVDMQTYIVQEYCDAGNLSDYCIIHGLRQEGQLPTGHEMLRLLFRLREVADGMHYLHSTARVVHGDLKGSNILLCVSPTAPYGRTVKIADFGLARVYTLEETHKLTRTLGTVNHTAPELLRFGKASPASDVYAFGILMWELLTGRVPFAGCQWGAILELVALLGQRPELPEGAPEDYCVLMESCWAQDPAQRPTFEEVLTCINIMLTSRQQELMEQAAGVSTQSHTLTTSLQHVPLCATAGNSSAAVNTTGTAVQGADLTVSIAGATSTATSSGEWDLVRMGSMRKGSGGTGTSNVVSSSCLPTQQPPASQQSSSPGFL